jgi:hypothetical protein
MGAARCWDAECLALRAPGTPSARTGIDSVTKARQAAVVIALGRMFMATFPIEC